MFFLCFQTNYNMLPVLNANAANTSTSPAPKVYGGAYKKNQLHDHHQSKQSHDHHHHLPNI